MSRRTARVADLVTDLASTGSHRTLVAFAAYPRSGTTGDLSRIGGAVDSALALLSTAGGRPFRVMHAIGVVVLPVGEGAVSLAREVCRVCAAPEVEMRAVVVEFTGPRDPAWLDDLIGDVSVRRNLGLFSREPAVRIVDGELVPGTFRG